MMKWFSLLLCFTIIPVFGEDVKEADFKELKKILENDLLDERQKVQERKKKRSQALKRQRLIKKSSYPSEQEFWSFLSEYWLVKNAQVLNWDFQKPDYGLEKSLKDLLESFGFYEEKIKVLIINTPSVAHFALPANPKETIFLISLPFIRTMDLTKLEISLLFFEGFLRNKEGYFLNYVKNKEIKKVIGGSFYGKKFKRKAIDKTLNQYSTFVFKKGFNFQQQFNLTRKVDRYLKSNLTLWNGYLNLLKKIDKLVKENKLYQYYTKIYPSPEMQINWMSEKKSQL